MDLQMSLAIARRRTQLRSSREKRHYTFAASIDLLYSIRRSKDRLDPNKLCRASHKSTSHQRGQASHWPTTEAMHLCTPGVHQLTLTALSPNTECPLPTGCRLTCEHPIHPRASP